MFGTMPVMEFKSLVIGVQEGWEKRVDELAEPCGDYKVGDKGGPRHLGLKINIYKAKGYSEIHSH